MDECPDRDVRVTINEDTVSLLNYNESGLIPAIVLDIGTNRPLMLAYMNRESLGVSLREGRTCFYSRSRKKLWRKGETSGNTQTIVRISADCEYNSLLVEVIPDGPACHTGEYSCFFNALYDNNTSPAFSLGTLYDIVKARKAERPDGSYTTYLFDKGLEKIAKKVGEESAEVIIASIKQNRDELIYETADLCYHMLVLLCEAGIEPAAIVNELDRRHTKNG